MNNSLSYIRYHLWRDRNFLIVYCIFLISIFPLFSFGLHFSVNKTDRMTLFLIILFFVMFIVAFLLPIYLFHFLWNRREMDLYSCVGMKRKTFFTNIFFLGILYLWAFPGISLIITIPIIQVNFLDWEVLSIIGKIFTLTLLLYSFNTWAAIVSHSRLDAIILTVCYFIIPILLIASVMAMFSQYANEFIYCHLFDLFYESLLGNPLVRWLACLISVPTAGGLLIIEIILQFFVNETPVDFWLIPSGIWIIWLAICWIFYFGAKRSFILKKAEDAQTPTRSLWTYPMVISLLTLALFIFSYAWGYDHFLNPPFIVSVFLYFVLWFIAQRKIHIRLFQVVICIGLLICMFSAKSLFVQTSGFGFIQEKIPENIERLKIEITLNDMEESSYYTITTKVLDRKTEEKEMQELIKLQDRVIEDKKAEPDSSRWQSNAAVMVDVNFYFYIDDIEYTRHYTLMDDDADQKRDKYIALMNQLVEEGYVKQKQMEGLGVHSSTVA